MKNIVIISGIERFAVSIVHSRACAAVKEA
jgi:hypothetical protein